MYSFSYNNSIRLVMGYIHHNVVSLNAPKRNTKMQTKIYVDC